MRYVIPVVAVLLIGYRLWRRRQGQPPWLLAAARARLARRHRTRWDGPSSPVGLVAAREIRERLRSRAFRIGTGLVLLVVIAGVIIPVLRQGSHPHENVGVVGTLSAPLRQAVLAVGADQGVEIDLTQVPSESVADQQLQAKQINLAIVDGQRVVVKSASSLTGDRVVAAVAQTVALQSGLQQAGLAPEQAAALLHPKVLPVTSLEPAAPPANRTARVTTTYGLILIYILLTQYGTWILMGVVEEKANRVVEVLLSTIRTSQMLTGKVVGLGAVALAQGTLLVTVALVLAAAVGSDLVKGAAPVVVVSILVWLVLGYIFYCWVYAAAGALASRQEHVQSLAFPLQVPILFGYIVSLTALASQHPSTFIHVLAYLPPTAPFAMSVLVADSAVAWWQVVISAALIILATVGVARLATTVYSRAILRTGRRVRLGEVLGHAAA
ncbi:MAG: ABC transporter permease [Actinomycetota bacterium]|nr:ABC transporter permease [Actinomycetota bacterium]